MLRATSGMSCTLLLLVSAASQAAMVTTQIGSSVSVLEPFYEFNLPAEPAVGMQVTETFGAHVLQINHYVTVRYDSDFFSVQTSASYHPETALVGTRLHEYVGYFDPETNELLGANWQVISENVFEETFEIGASTQFLQQIGGGNPDDPPPPPPEIVPLPPAGLLLAGALSCGLLSPRLRRIRQLRVNPSSWSPGNRAAGRRS